MTISFGVSAELYKSSMKNQQLKVYRSSPFIFIENVCFLFLKKIFVCLFFVAFHFISFVHTHGAQIISKLERESTFRTKSMFFLFHLLFKCEPSSDLIFSFLFIYLQKNNTNINKVTVTLFFFSIVMFIFL